MPTAGTTAQATQAARLVGVGPDDPSSAGYDEQLSYMHAAATNPTVPCRARMVQVTGEFGEPRVTPHLPINSHLDI